MIASLESDIRDAIVACQNYYLANRGSFSRTGTMYAKLSKALTTTLKAMADIHTLRYSDYEPDEQHPGYLIKSKASMLFRVPYHVLPTFQSDDSLTAMWTLSQRVQSSNRSTIAISGSNVLRTLFEFVGDIDFCEYFSVTDGFDRVIANLDGNSDMVCLKLAVSAPFWKWNDPKPTVRGLSGAIDPADVNRSTFKMDYAGNIDHFGVTEISNMIIALDDNGKSAGLVKTFSGQEVPLTPVDWLPNQMNDPIEMGRYVDWLARAVKSLQSSDPRKCLKRSASLSRILCQSDTTNRIERVSRNHRPFFLRHQLSQIQGLGAMLSSLSTLNDERPLRLVEAAKDRQNELSKELETLAAEPEALQLFVDDVRSIANELLAHVRTDH